MTAGDKRKRQKAPGLKLDPPGKRPNLVVPTEESKKSLLEALSRELLAHTGGFLEFGREICPLARTSKDLHEALTGEYLVNIGVVKPLFRSPPPLSAIQGGWQIRQLAVEACTLEELKRLKEPQFARLETLDIRLSGENADLEDLSFLARLAHLRHLQLDGLGTKVVDLGALHACAGTLRSLSFWGFNTLQDIGVLSQCLSLEKLEIEGGTWSAFPSPLADLSPLRTCTNLRTLGLYAVDGLRELDLPCPNLEKLRVIGAKSLTAIKVRSDVLDTVAIRSAPNLSDLSGLWPCKGLRHLRLEDAHSVHTLTVEKWAALRTLKIKQCNNLRAVTGMGRCTALENVLLRRLPMLERLDTLGCDALKTVDTADCPRLTPESVQLPTTGLVTALPLSAGV